MVETTLTLPSVAPAIPVLPDRYRGLDDDEVIERIMKLKARYGSSLTILGHHYQDKRIVRFSDHIGDSFGLSVAAASEDDAKYILFCGVHFMAESAAVLCRDDQIVLHPDLSAGCPMADMSNIEQVEWAWEDLAAAAGDKKVVPVTYMNSDADLKAFCGRNGGIVCTSSNAGAVFDWAFERGETILFFPDEHLGWNTGREWGIRPEEKVLWDSRYELGGLTLGDLGDARLILWKGYCHVHTHFTLDHIAHARATYPGIGIVVHPECTAEVVDAADESGSTGFICQYVEEAPKGATIAIGTEINLISRLAEDYPDKTIVALSNSMCPNMFKVSINDVLWTLENLGEVNVVEMDEDVKSGARLALERMLQVGG